ncbi:MAG: hypothetical protein SNG10_03595 [Rikenellaceae bacterium]
MQIKIKRELKFNSNPITKNILAHLFGIGVQLLNQVLLVPVYLKFWGTDLYSDWIVISAISSLFSVSDIGLNSVTNNEFVMCYATNKARCRTLLTNNYVIILSIASIVIFGALVYISCFDITQNLGLHELSRSAGGYIFIALIVHIFLGMVASVRESIYRANSITHRGVYISNIARLSESLIILMSLLLHLPMTTMVSIYLLPRITMAIYKIMDTNKIFSYHFNTSQFDLHLAKRIFIPSISFISFPLGNAIVYQGFTLVVNRFLGANSVVLFNTTRTLCSFMRQILLTMQYSVWPEYSKAYGAKDINRMRRLHRKAFSIAIWGSVLMSVAILLVGPFIYKIWTVGRVEFSYPLMISFLVITLFNISWSTSSVCLMATNKHSRMGVLYIATATLSIAVATIVAAYTSSLPLIEYCLLITHIPLSIYVIRDALRMTHDNLQGLLNFIGAF